MTSVNITENKYSVSVTEGATTVVTVKAPGPAGAGISAGDKGSLTVAANLTDWTLNDSVVTNAKVSASAAIAGTKISPNFGSQNIFTEGNFTINSLSPAVNLNDTEDNPDYRLANSNGIFKIRDTTNSVDRFKINATGNINIPGNLDVDAGLDVSGGDITGTLGNGVTATTQSAGNSTTRVATTAFVTTAINNLINGAPSALDTLNELAAAMNDDAAFSTTVTNSLATKMPLAGGEFTGNITFSGSQTVDGRDLSVDGSKLDGIEAGATADQTASEILTLLKTVDGAGSGLDADTLDGISSASFVRSDANDGISGFLTITNDSGIKILTNTNGVGSKIQFSDHAGGSYEQNGTLTYKHGDGAVTTTGGNSNDGWLFEGSETRTVVKVVGDIEATSNIYGGNIFIPDNDNVNFGSGNDLTIVHDGTDSKITNKTGDLLIEAKNAETGIKVIPDGAVELYHDDVKKAETTSTGLTISGNLFAGHLNAALDGNTSISLRDTGHGFPQSEIKLSNGGRDLNIVAPVDIRLFPLGGENGIVIEGNGTVELYFNNLKKLATTATGLDVTGSILPDADNTNALGSSSKRFTTLHSVDLNTDKAVTTSGGFNVIGTVIKLRNTANDADLVKIFHSGTGGNGLITSEIGNVKIQPNEDGGQVQLFQTTSGTTTKRLSTTNNGIDVNGDIRGSSGILFNNDTADANTLDDYEEGTWTPTVLSEGNIDTPHILAHTQK